MRIQICAVGRMRAGPERDLTSDYLNRFDKIGRNLGFGPATLSEIEDKKGGGPQAEAFLLKKALPNTAFVLALDERGKTVSSPEFAQLLSGWRDAGHSELAILIGGADGLAPDLRSQAQFTLSFGAMVWPHMLVRAMLAEQLYRAVSILAGAPYHRS